MAISDNVWAVIISSGVTSLIWVAGKRWDRKDRLIADNATVRVEHIHDRQSLTDDQAALITNLQTRCDKLQTELDGLQTRFLEAREAMVELKAEVKSNQQTIERLRDENRKSRQDCEDQILRLTDENATLRTENSTLINENAKLGAAIKAAGLSVEDTVKTGRRSSDKLNDKPKKDETTP